MTNRLGPRLADGSPSGELQTVASLRKDLVLYHYTSLSALDAILRNKFVWASHVLFTNDRQEVKHAVDLVREILTIRLRDSTNSVEGAKLERLSAGVDKALNSVLGSDMYIFCMSMDGDLLSQWRAYCPSEGGYALGFRYGDLEKCLDKQSIEVWPCVYDPQTQRKILSDSVDQLLNEFKDAAEEKQESMTLGFFEGNVHGCALSFKHPSFSEEQEWRALTVPWANLNPQYRVSRNIAVPSLALQLAIDNSLPLHQIIVGPNKHQELAMKGIKHLLNVNGFNRENSEQIVVPSKIPYRLL